MAVLQFPKRKPSASEALRKSALAQRCQHLEAQIVLDDWLADAVTTAAGRAQVTPAAYIVRVIRAMFEGRAA